MYAGITMRRKEQLDRVFQIDVSIIIVYPEICIFKIAQTIIMLHAILVL